MINLETFVWPEEGKVFYEEVLTCVIVTNLQVEVSVGSYGGDGRGHRRGRRLVLAVTVSHVVVCHWPIGGWVDQVATMERVMFLRRSALHLITHVTGLRCQHWQW